MADIIPPSKRVASFCCCCCFPSKKKKKKSFSGYVVTLGIIIIINIQPHTRTMWVKETKPKIVGWRDPTFFFLLNSNPPTQPTLRIRTNSLIGSFFSLFLYHPQFWAGIIPPEKLFCLPTFSRVIIIIIILELYKNNSHWPSGG
jgi:hypothetical protein